MAKSKCILKLILRQAATFFASNNNNCYQIIQLKQSYNINARDKLDAFNEEADEFVGEIAIADLYIELEGLNEAIYWFE